MPTCHISLPVPSRLVNKRSDSQSIDLSDKILYTNNSKSRLSSKSKEIGTTPLSEIHIHKHGDLDTAKFSQDRVENLVLTIKSCKQVSARTFLSLLGKLSATADFVLLGRLHLHPLQMCLLSVWRPHILPLDHPIPITGMIRSISFTMVDEHKLLPKILLYTDASHFGWGAHLEPMRLYFHGHWTEDQSQLHINMLEMMAIRFTLK